MRSLILLALFAIALGALSGCGTTSSSASQAKTTTTTTAPATAAAKGAAAATPGTVNVTVTEWRVTPSAASAKAGKVTFAVTNTGKAKHEFVVLKTDKAASALGAGMRVPEAGNVGETGDIAAGARKSVTLNLKPGHYVLVCNLPGHYMAGMKADFTVAA
jgi:uncharacterized cupredoxin-like copper-binding protein